MTLTPDERLKRRKLDALRRGVHRVGGEADLPFNIHLVAIGRAGAEIAAQVFRSLQPADRPMSALVIDVGEADLAGVRQAAAELPTQRADVEVIAVEPAGTAALAETFAGYEQSLTLEYPMFPWKLDGMGWLPEGAPVETESGLRRAYAKALYGRAYYEGARPLARALRRFGDRIESERAQSVVCIAFGLGGGTGSGMAVDLARHLTNVVLGRRALVVGVGVLPCDGDAPEHRGGGLFAALNEFDCLGDETKNSGVVASCGQLFRNPFTAGLLLVPQQPVWEATRDLAETHRRVNAEVASLLTDSGGAHLMEALRLLNWVAAPSTQHSAARTPWGAKWIHMFGFTPLEEDGAGAPHTDLRAALGIGESYQPEFIEVRLPATDDNGGAIARIDAAFAPEVPPQVVHGGPAGSAQFLLPSLEKTDLAWFGRTRSLYADQSYDEKLLDHALLLEQGIVLSEPSARMVGMAGAALRDGTGWVNVPMAELLGVEEAV